MTGFASKSILTISPVAVPPGPWNLSPSSKLDHDPVVLPIGRSRLIETIGSLYGAILVILAAMLELA